MQICICYSFHFFFYRPLEVFEVNINSLDPEANTNPIQNELPKKKDNDELPSFYSCNSLINNAFNTRSSGSTEPNKFKSIKVEKRREDEKIGIRFQVCQS